MYDLNWFDSKPERDLANLADSAEDVTAWIRLLRGDLEVLWGPQASSYNPDFIVIDTAGVSWLVEVKADRHANDEDVRSKATAAIRWANRVSADDSGNGKWKYILATESDLADSRGSWTALTRLSAGQ